MIWHRRGDISAPANGDAPPRPAQLSPRRRQAAPRRHDNMRISVALARARICILEAVHGADNKGPSLVSLLIFLPGTYS